MLSGWTHLSDEDKTAIQSAATGQSSGRGPWHLEIQPTNKCNAKCFFCFNNIGQGFPGNETLPWGTLKPLLEDLSQRDLKSLRLAGGGEPLIYPQIRPLLEQCANLGLCLSDVTTNAIALSSVASDLVAIGLDAVCVSLNEPNAEQWALSMHSSPRLFDRAIDGIHSLNTARNRPSQTHTTLLRIQFTLWKENWSTLPQMWRLGKELGADRILIRSLQGIPADKRIEPAVLPDVKGLLCDVIEQDAHMGMPLLEFDLGYEGDLAEFAQGEIERVRPPQQLERPAFLEPDSGKRWAYCLMPWYGAMLNATGGVYPCCILVQEEMGNVLRESWDSIWWNKRFHCLRKGMQTNMLLDGDIEYSRKLHAPLDPKCVRPFDCLWSYALADRAFYDSLVATLQEDVTAKERFLIRAGNRCVRALHHVLKRIRPT